MAVHHLVTVPKAAIYVAAASRDQASIIYQYARDFATHPSVAERIVVRHLELRGPGGAFLRVLASDAPKLHGLTPSLAIVDELHAFRDAEVYLALRTAMLKRPGSRLITISTAGQGVESPLGRLRARALALPQVRRQGPLTDARGESLRMLDWAVPEDGDVDDMRQVKRANPASWITTDLLREQREAVPDLAFRRYHCGQWTQREGSWLPPGVWQASVGEPRFAQGEPIYLALDVGGSRADTALVWLNESYQVGCSIWSGDDGILQALDKIRELRETYTVRELAFDPWRAQQAALELERDGMTCVVWPQTDARACPASDRLHRALIEGRLTLPPDPKLAEHATNVIQRHSRRGWRLDAPSRSDNIDGIVALMMGLDRLEHRPEPVRLVGWL
jgi:phage terminase large subunit-like protein